MLLYGATSYLNDTASPAQQLQQEFSGQSAGTQPEATRGPLAVVATIPGCGHAPALNVPEQLALVERFLSARQSPAL